ncbi:dipicolinate synthase subunit A [Niallia circulans]|uniref:dipicolinic acid synthetase subunit A n=1 Tax=Shouchella clausii TaxID=79880 RepID=UPI000BA5EA5E|nr:dipicolinic acid synthetase subunit A [Shouchella clausii]MCM3546976.1 dipicolinic acid synthetase subunit A [Shouchella clausii]PAD93809.1 dipicolinic acid synthetase subunit A [Shouchella clausii]PAF15683.1 dipicolinic acid synthetase subunit A [Shouchella clausii]SPU22218.1 dipicolinate synthase subunit A [Niallia circulans]
MLTGTHVVMIGGDARQLEIIRKLSALDAKISLVGFEQLNDGFIGTSKQELPDIEWSTVDAILLPVGGMSNDGLIASVFSNEQLKLKAAYLNETPDHCTIYTGISTDRLEKLAAKAKCKIVLLMDRDDVAIYNSIPTAEGAVMLAIQHTDHTIHHAKVAVLGLGRIGMTIARTFHALGASVFVGAKETALLARAFELGVEPFPLTALKETLKNIDLVINTIPAKIVTSDVLAELPQHAFVLDLASKPGGVDFAYAKKRGLKAMLVPGLPGMVAPKTAGKILANVLSDLLHEQTQS